MTHTPGPWAYRPQEYDDWGIVRMAGVDEDGFQRVICQANYVADPTELCEHRANGTDPAEANAKLIAAAPELLEALIKVVGCFDIKDGLSIRDEMAIKHATAIIAKATR